MKKVLTFIKREFLELLPPAVFFWGVFHLLIFTQALMMEEYGIKAKSILSATIGALLVGKSILIADATPFFHYFSQRRLIYNVIWRMFLYALIALLFQVLEELIPMISKYGLFSAVSEHFFNEINWPHFWAAHILLLVCLLVYSLATSIIDAIGRKAFIQILWVPKEKGKQLSY